jgi:hypothetical protein
MTALGTIMPPPQTQQHVGTTRGHRVMNRPRTMHHVLLARRQSLNTTDMILQKTMSKPLPWYLISVAFPDQPQPPDASSMTIHHAMVAGRPGPVGCDVRYSEA